MPAVYITSDRKNLNLLPQLTTFYKALHLNPPSALLAFVNKRVACRMRTDVISEVFPYSL